MEFNFKDSFVVRPTNEEGNKFIITCGDKIATSETYENREDAEQAIENKDWNLIATLAISIAEQAIRNHIDEQIKKEQK